MSSTKQLINVFKKKGGESCIDMGVSLEYADRIPTGLFPFDLCTGGGFPVGKMSLLYGPESSGKTNLALMAIGAAQKMWPDKNAVFIDAEYSLDGIWAEKLGVDTKNLVHVKPPHAEAAVDMFAKLIKAEDVSIIVFDSLAAMATTNEIDSDAEKMSVGGASLLVNKMIRKMNVAIGTHESPPAIILINQIRYKVGVLYGNPETLPGGNGQNFHTSLKIKITAKAEVDKKVNPLLPALKKTKGVIAKFKVPIVAQSFEYDMYTLKTPMFNPGECDDWTKVKKYLQYLGLIRKIKGGYGLKIEGHKKKFKTYALMRSYIYGNKSRELHIKKVIMNEMVKRTEADEKTLTTL